jgi:hypothetical protein
LQAEVVVGILLRDDTGRRSVSLTNPDERN